MDGGRKIVVTEVFEAGRYKTARGYLIGIARNAWKSNGRLGREATLEVDVAAAQLNITPATVKIRIHRARQKLECYR